MLPPNRFVSHWCASLHFRLRPASISFFLCALLLTLGAAGRLHAQHPDTLAHEQRMYRIETVEGEVVIGPLRSEDTTKVVLETRRFGTVTIERAAIKNMVELSPNRFLDGKSWFPNPQSTRYFFAPNALGIPKGEGYYQNTWLLFTNVNYGLSDQFSVGIGTIPIFFFGAPVLPFWLLPKVSLSSPRKNLHLAGGAMLGGILGPPWANTSAGLLYGSGTVGTRDHNVTLGLGYGYSERGISSTPVINVSGLTRIGRTTYLLSENYVFPGAEGKIVMSIGVRWAPKRFAVDVGLVRPLWVDVAGFVGYPWLGVTLPFGQ